jgi:CheY-like chemotaxis protein
MTALLRRTLGETVDLAVQASESPLLALADPGQVENALLNLAINARDAMPNGGSLVITVSRVRLTAESDGAVGELPVGEYIAVALTDTGMGMTPEVRARAFEPFFTTKETGKGSGLGLSMVYGFARQSGGDVVIDSTPGQGTTVTLYLPCARDVAATAMEAPTAGGELMPRGSETVLVVEDDAHVREFVVAVLVELGYRVLEAGTAHEALAILDAGETPDVLYTDVVLPGGMSGQELAERARRRQPSLRTLYTSGYTASALMPEDAAILLKPYRREDLARAIRDTFEPDTVCS